MYREIAEKCHAELLKNEKILTALKERRGLNDAVIKQYKIGYSKERKRYTYPVFNQDGACNNIRLYQFDRPRLPKIISWATGTGAPELWPLTNLIDKRDKAITICEGENDCLLLNQYGFNAITVTGAVGTWKDYWSMLFRDMDVNIIFDCQDCSITAAHKVRDSIINYTDKIKIIDLGLGTSGEDITDWFKKFKKTDKDLQEIIDNTAFNDGYRSVSLYDSLRSEYFDKKIKFSGLIIGKDMQPYIIPIAARFTCISKDRKAQACAMCRLNNAEKNYEYEISFEFEENKDDIVRMIRSNDMQIQGIFRKAAKIRSSKFCPTAYQFEITNRINIEDILIVPTIDEEKSNEQYVQRNGYYFGYDIQPNQSYFFYSTTWANPQNQAGINLIERVIPSKDNIDKFYIDDEIKEKLKIFQPAENTVEGIKAKLIDIYSDFTANITKMHKRQNILTAVDLVYHSVLKFKFMDRVINKGWLECTIIGDTKCGKSETIEQIVKHYRAGEWVQSSEHSTKAGILGGLEKSNRGSFEVRWGKIVINNRRLCIIDEADQLGQSGVLSLLSGVRSTGIAELVKIQSQKAEARTRLIFISNPQPGMMMRDHNFGVEAVRELFKAHQDISRIDFALIIAEGDVKSETINSKFIKEHDHKYFTENCHLSVMFAWSRKCEHIKIMPDAEGLILNEAIRFGKKYTSDIPLVMSSEMRIKLARMAVALATRLYSTDDTGENVIVLKEHVEVIIDFLEKQYDSDIFGYRDYSEQRRRAKHLGNVDFFINDGLNNYSDKKEQLEVLNMFLDTDKFSIADFEDIFGFTDFKEAKKFTGQMARSKMILRSVQNYYAKTPAFINWIKGYRKKLQGQNEGEGEKIPF